MSVMGLLYPLSIVWLACFTKADLNLNDDISSIDPNSFESLCISGECPEGWWKNEDGDCIKYMNGITREVCRKLGVEYTVNIKTREDVCLVRRETQCDCGRTNRLSKIVYGMKTEKNEYPWQGKLPIIVLKETKVNILVHLVKVLDMKNSRFFCGGSIVKRDKILTAAHCTEGNITN